MSQSRISEHFVLDEVLHTEHLDHAAELLALWNASPEIRANVLRTAAEVLEPVRSVLRVPLRISSWLRTPGLNHAVGGRPDSRHLYGLAVDVIPTEGLDPLGALYCLMHAMRRGELTRLDKAIVEGREGARWLHLQAAADGRVAQHLALASEDGREFARLA